MFDKIKILYEDDDVLVVNKPTGLLVHPDGRTKDLTLQDWILEHYPNSTHITDVALPSTDQKDNSLPTTDYQLQTKYGIVHRLDRDTSGVLLIAKTQENFENLKRQFQSRKVGKEYRAYVYGTVKEDDGVIDRPIGKSAKDFRKWSAQRGARGALRPARTRYQTLSRGDGWSYLAVFPETGRTHQIRVHLKAINHPVVCDALYAPKQPCILGFDRLALHAHKISFTGLNGAEHTIEAPLPEEFKKLIN